MKNACRELVEKLAQDVWGAIMSTCAAAACTISDEVGRAKVSLVGQVPVTQLTLTENYDAPAHVDAYDPPLSTVLWLLKGEGILHNGWFALYSLGLQFLPLHGQVGMINAKLLPHGTKFASRAEGDTIVRMGSAVWARDSVYESMCAFEAGLAEQGPRADGLSWHQIAKRGREVAAVAAAVPHRWNGAECWGWRQG